MPTSTLSQTYFARSLACAMSAGHSPVDKPSRTCDNRNWRFYDMDSTRALTAARERIGISQKALAEITGISTDKLSKIEHGDRQIKPEELVTLSFALGVAPADLLDKKASPQLRPGAAESPAVREGLGVLDQFIENCHYIDGLAALSGQS